MRRAKPLDLTSQKVLAALQEMGVSRTQILEMQASPTQADLNASLETLKTACKKGFRAAARRLHPDQNEGATDQAEKTERFKYLRSVYERFSVVKFVVRPKARNPGGDQPFRVYAESVRRGANKNRDVFYQRPFSSDFSYTYSYPSKNPDSYSAIKEMMEKMRQRQQAADMDAARRYARQAADLNEMRAREQELKKVREEVEKRRREEREGRARRRRREAKAREARKTEEAQSRKKGTQFRGGVDSSVKSAPGVLASDALFEESSHQTFDGISGWYSDYTDRSFEEMDAEIDIILRKMGIR